MPQGWNSYCSYTQFVGKTCRTQHHATHQTEQRAAGAPLTPFLRFLPQMYRHLPGHPEEATLPIKESLSPVAFMTTNLQRHDEAN